jgi:hypothetical protein
MLIGDYKVFEIVCYGSIKLKLWRDNRNISQYIVKDKTNQIIINKNKINNLWINKSNKMLIKEIKIFKINNDPFHKINSYK